MGELNENWMKFIGDDLKLENEQLNTQLGGHRPTQLGDDDGDEFPLFALDNIGSNVSDDLLGDNFDENEVDHDSDSDSDEEDAVNINDSDKKESEYELPQDAFSRLTQKIDDIADETNNETMIELNMSQKQKNETKEQNTEDLDKWLNDDGDDWSNFDKIDDKEIEEQNISNLSDDKVQINEIDNDKMDDFDNWDHDPFADQNLFETEDE